MYFVYLPDFSKISKGNNSPYHQIVFNTVDSLNIPIIDMYEEVFTNHDDPLSLFPFRSDGHYNSNGYLLIANKLFNKLSNGIN